jgi:antitoxin VapB
LYIRYIFVYTEADMALSIRNEKVENLARIVSRSRGESLTDAIGHALEAEITSLRSRTATISAELTNIAAEFAAAPDLDTRRPEVILGYDESGAFSDGY